MIPISVYILFSISGILMLRFTYRFMLIEALNSGEIGDDTQAVRKNVMIKIASLILLVAIVFGSGFGYLIWKVEAFQGLAEVGPMGLLFLLLTFSIISVFYTKGY